jgi:hypothetical protein
VGFADAARTGRLVCEINGESLAAREILALTAEVGRLAQCLDRKRSFASGPNDAEAWAHAPETTPSHQCERQPSHSRRG